MHFIAQFFAGAFLVNCVPHLASGLLGEPFPSPFAKPPGVGNSAPMVNFFWGLFNLVAGLVLLKVSPISVGLNSEFVVFLVGVTVLGVQLSWHFGAVRAKH